MTGPATLVCAGCGYAPPSDAPYPFRCARADRGDDTDHILTVVLDPARVRFPDGTEPNPFVRYRTLLHSYHRARAGGLSDADYVGLVEDLDRAVAAVDGRGFRVTPFDRSAPLSARLGLGGGVWVKDETGNVSGSHKGRHLMGLLIHLAVAERTGLAAGEGPDLAIASCGNAALAAAVVARAGRRTLRVFVPTTADPVVVAALRRLGAHLTVVPRAAGVAGDPTYRALRAAVRNGALPFTCQGSSNGLTIEGGKTLGYEMVSRLQEEDVVLDRVFLQVGGGALASAVVQAFQDAQSLGALARLPKFHAVQTRGGYPLQRAYDRVAARLLDRFLDGRTGGGGADAAARAAQLRAPEAAAAVAEELRYAVTHRSEFMWPWGEEPRSIAGGILDDETYDWAAVVRGMLETGGYPVVVEEDTLREANRLGRETTGRDVDPTGSAGLAGLLALRMGGAVGAEERLAVLFTGVRRQGTP